MLKRKFSAHFPCPYAIGRFSTNQNSTDDLCVYLMTNYLCRFAGKFDIQIDVQEELRKKKEFFFWKKIFIGAMTLDEKRITPNRINKKKVMSIKFQLVEHKREQMFSSFPRSIKSIVLDLHSNNERKLSSKPEHPMFVFLSVRETNSINKQTFNRLFLEFL